MLKAEDAYSIAMKSNNRHNPLEICLKHIEHCANQGNFSTNYYTPEYYDYLSDADISRLNELGYIVRVMGGGNWYKISW